MAHTSVLLHESIEGLSIRQGDVFVDATLGDGGHSAEVLSRFGESVNVIGIDRDQDMIDRVSNRFAAEFPAATESGSITLVQGNFRNIEKILKEKNINQVDRVLFDVGFNSRQIEESKRGFSFQKDEPLIMTFERPRSGTSDSPVTARDVVNDWQEENLAAIIAGFGEERYAKRIARGIVEARAVQQIETTGELVRIIKASTPFYYHHGAIHPATRTFQAIRIAVNDELEAIREGLQGAWNKLTPGGRIAVIAFHSLEDRIVKHYFVQLASTGAKKVTKKPITATEEEMKINPRSRSAKLRIIEKPENY